MGGAAGDPGRQRVVGRRSVWLVLGFGAVLLLGACTEPAPNGPTTTTSVPGPATCTTDYLGPAGGPAETAANWSGGTVPGPDDWACDPDSRGILVSGDLSVFAIDTPSLTVAATGSVTTRAQSTVGNVALSGSLLGSGGWTLSGGTLAGIVAGSGEVTADGPVVVDGLRMEGSARLQLAGQDLVGTVEVCGTASVELRNSSRVAAGASAVFNSAGCPAGASGRLLVTDGANLSVDGVLDVAGIAFTNDGVMSGSGVLAGRYGGAGDVVPDAPAFTIDGAYAPSGGSLHLQIDGRIGSRVNQLVVSGEADVRAAEVAVDAGDLSTAPLKQVDVDDLVVASSVLGPFADASLPTGGGVATALRYTPTSIGLDATCAAPLGPHADLRDTDLRGCDLTGIDLTGADLSGADLGSTTLEGTNFTDAELTRVRSGGVSGRPGRLDNNWNVVSGYLIGPGADLSGSDLAGVDLSGFRLSGVDFTAADLTGADLSGTLLDGADLTDADLTNADLTGATLTDADLSSTAMAGASLDGVVSSGIIGTPASLPDGWTLSEGTLTYVGPTQLAAGYGFACARLNDGTVRCWGANTEGQLGNGTTKNSPVPVEVAGLTNVAEVAAGDSFACARRTDGTVWCWGQGAHGQLGNGTGISSSSPKAVTGISDATDIDAGVSHACAVRSGGTVSCWGLGIGAQLGNGGRTSSRVPVAASGLTGATAVATGHAATCALQTSGSLSCWGDGMFGLNPSASAVPVAMTSPPPATALMLARQHGCVLTPTATLNCWGVNNYGELGRSIFAVLSPTALSSLTGVSAVDGGVYATCALLSSGGVRCLGFNESGQLGDATTTSTSTPVAVAGLTDATSLGVGDRFACALRRGGTVVCWGDNESGQLGNDTTNASSQPVTVLGLPSTTAVTSRTPTASVRIDRLPGGAMVGGRATDPDATAPLTVRVSVDGAPYTLSTDGGGGFSRLLPITATDMSTVCVTIENVGPGEDVSPPCSSLPGTLPMGGITNFSLSGTTLSMSGWAIDYGSQAPAAVQVEWRDAAGAVIGPSYVTLASQSGLRVPWGQAYGTSRSWSMTRDLSTLARPASTVCVSALDPGGFGPGRKVACSTLTPRSTPPSSPSYEFLQASDGLPKRQNTCAPLTYVINPRWFSEAGLEDLQNAIQIAEQATGIDFRFEGFTDEPPSFPRPSVDTIRYGNRPSPVLFAAATGDHAIEYNGNVVGFAGPAVSGNTYAGGQVTVRRDVASIYETGYGPGSTLGKIALHEIAHMLGLNHVSDPNQLMYPNVQQVPMQYAAGDLQGLSYVGAAPGCWR